MMFVDRYESPKALASVANAPLVVCELIFALTCGDQENIRLIRSGHDVLDSETTRQRSAVSWVARSATHSSFPQIGRALNMDHSAVLRANLRARLLRRTDHEFRAMCDRLAATLKTPNRVRRRAMAA